jgi:hypothetical protein
MRSIGKLFTAFATLADSVLSLAGVIDVATVRLRQQLALDEAGHVIEHQPVESEPTSSAKRSKKSV